MRVALGQTNPTVGDLEGNADLILRTLKAGADLGADMVLLPELAVTGYPPEDLLQKPSFLRDAQETLAGILRSAPQVLACVGYPRLDSDSIRNSAAIFRGSEILDIYDKGTLPNYGVFDEKRYFRPSVRCPVYRWGHWRVSVNICEDLWPPGGVPKIQAYEGGAHLIVNISASPYHSGKAQIRESLLRRRARQYGAYVLYANQVGGQDELVYDGRSVAVSPGGEIIARAKAFEEDLLLVNLPPRPPLARPDPDLKGDEPFSEGLDYIEEHLYLDQSAWPGSPKQGSARESRVEPIIAEEEEDYRALLLGLRDYVRKNGFRTVVVGLSGGIDSALTATLAADALGSGAVRGVAMPSRYSSPESVDDARELARRLDLQLDVLPIEESFQAYLKMLKEPFSGREPDVTEENLQARIRGNLLMAYSNKFGNLVLATGNKSELAVGYCTLYGDMVGGFAILKDVFKTRVYRLARWRNAQGPGEGPIPQSTLQKPPSAELRPNQLDEDTLPPYEILDPILERLVQREQSPEEIVAAGFDPGTVHKVCGWVDANEYKRRQAPPGVRLTPRAFGKDRRYPITNRYRHCHE